MSPDPPVIKMTGLFTVFIANSPFRIKLETVVTPHRAAAYVVHRMCKRDADRSISKLFTVRC
jgi:hypothetical protein